MKIATSILFLILLICNMQASEIEISDRDIVNITIEGNYHQTIMAEALKAFDSYFYEFYDTTTQCKAGITFEVPAPLVARYAHILSFATKKVSVLITSRDMEKSSYDDIPTQFLLTTLQLRNAWRQKNIDKILKYQRMIPAPWEYGAPLED